MNEQIETTEPAAVAAPGIRRYRSLLSCLVHGLLFLFAFFAAFGVYFNFKRFDQWFLPFFVPLAPFAVAIKMLVFWWMKLFRGTWRYVGMRDVMAVGMASNIGAFFFILLFYGFVNVYPEFLNSRPVFPTSVFLIDWGCTIAFVVGSRSLVRFYYEEIRSTDAEGIHQCLIVGAGDTGEALLREINRMKATRYAVIGFLDDDPLKQGLRIHDVPVLGRVSEAREYCERYNIDELLIAMPNAPQKLLREIVELCEGTNVRFRTIPAMEAVIEGKVTVSQIRDVEIKDLLGREQVELDVQAIRDNLHDRVVLVTGAGGSIGSEMCRQIAKFEPRNLLMLEQAENNLFEIDRELNRTFSHVPRQCCIADICDAERIERLFNTFKPAVIFHAAAHKHVPMMEMNPGEAVKNNILGTKTIADTAKRHGVRRFVMISTDKAVNPTSVMGCTKRVAEMYIQQLRQESTTQYMTVRFGNVLGSSGSVIPIFKKQIAEGGPVTVTDPRMTRYFMTIPEASQLVMQAGVMGSDGDIFVLDMGEPVKIVDLAKEMITLSGLRIGEDIEIEFSGIRPGEKLYEELSVKGENMGPTTHEKIYVWRNRKEDWNKTRDAALSLIHDCNDLAPEAIRQRLCEIVPEFRPEALGFDNSKAAADDAQRAAAEAGRAALDGLSLKQTPAT